MGGPDEPQGRGEDRCHLGGPDEQQGRGEDRCVGQGHSGKKEDREVFRFKNL